MKKKSIFVSLVLALILSFTSINADVTVIKDIDKSSAYAKESILALADMDIVKGDNIGNFNPTKAISRAEFVALLVRVLELDIETAPENATFKDVPKTHWAFKYVEAAYKAGIVNGVSPTEFGVSKISTREQMAVMFVRALKLVDSSKEIELKSIQALTDRSSIATWAEKEVDIAMTAGLMNGVSATTFAPKKNATKEQTAVVIDRFIKNEDVIVEKVNAAYNTNIEIKYPNLYNALKAGSGQNYIGDMEMTIDMQMTDLDTKDFMKSYSEAYSTINKDAMQTYTYTKLESNTDEPIEYETETIITADKVYELDVDDKWIEYSKSEWESVNGTSTNDFGVITTEFVDGYAEMPIQDAGTVQLDNVTAEKYVMSLDSAAMKKILPEEQYNEIGGVLGDVYQGTEKYDIEFYVVDGHIVREVVKFSGIASDSETGLRLELIMVIDVNYTNIGVEGEIVLPAAAEIKQAE